MSQGPAARRLETAAVRVRIPLRRPFATAAGTWRERDAWIVRLRDRDDRDGFGEAGLPPSAGTADLDELAASIRAAVARLGVDGDLDPWLVDVPASPAGRAVRGAIESAALDLGLVGFGVEAAADIAVNATIATEDQAESVAAARHSVELGFRCLKLKGGSEATTADLVRRLAAVRVAVGPDVSLRLDVNGAWDPRDALDRMEAIAALDIAYVEQPIASDDPAALAVLRHAAPVPIALDESVTSPAAAQALIAADAADVLVVKPARVGGPATAMEIARFAVEAGVGVTISTFLETGVGLVAAARVAAALPERGHAHGLATGDLLGDDLLASPLTAQQGRLSVPGPGLRIAGAAIDRWAVDRAGAPW